MAQPTQPAVLKAQETAKKAATPTPPSDSTPTTSNKPRESKVR
jgi:hypothetical protein